MDKTPVVIRLELIAAKAKQLASDLANHKLWEGELQSGLSEIAAQVNQAMREASDR